MLKNIYYKKSNGLLLLFSNFFLINRIIDNYFRFLLKIFFFNVLKILNENIGFKKKF
jgi:hypothetical protein